MSTCQNESLHVRTVCQWINTYAPCPGGARSGGSRTVVITEPIDTMRINNTRSFIKIPSAANEAQLAVSEQRGVVRSLGQAPRSMLDEPMKERELERREPKDKGPSDKGPPRKGEKQKGRREPQKQSCWQQEGE